ncbi:hypothetical protein IAI10_16375 [Clostridium sp. 19966]|uniref:OmpL47-type beta-barrel domain-containing protein n=1 Tax=Clostridium sp. 19966 TaxID=2768166 RepID=UPI0028DDFE84|nr:hypothetical protein [Clostridium sp. 19966]MDT8718244.1 hypothetical protein [Clostridium sp. 19966]
MKTKLSILLVLLLFVCYIPNGITTNALGLKETVNSCVITPEDGALLTNTNVTISVTFNITPYPVPSNQYWDKSHYQAMITIDGTTKYNDYIYNLIDDEYGSSSDLHKWEGSVSFQASLGYGSHTVIAYYNNTKYTTNTFTITNADTTPPTAPTVNLSRTGWGNNNVSFSITNGTDSGSGVSKSQYQIDSSTGSWTDYSSQVTVSTEGSHIIYARTLDNSGNISAVASSSFGIDKTAPVLNLTTDTTSPVSSITLTANASDNLSGIKSITLPSGNVVNSSSTTYVVTANGSYTFTSTDNAGNTISQTITVNNIKTVSLTVNSTTYSNSGHVNASSQNILFATVNVTVTANNSYSLIISTTSDLIGSKQNISKSYLMAQIDGVNSSPVSLGSGGSVTLANSLSATTATYNIKFYLQGGWIYKPDAYSLPVSITAQ